MTRCLEQGETRKLALAACRAGIDDVEVAYRFGASGRHLGGEALYSTVREATGAEGDVFVPESRIPRAGDDNPPQSWRATDVEALWECPIVGWTGPTVGQAVGQAMEAGEELPTRLECLGHGVADALRVLPLPGLREWLSRKACAAYRQGFLGNLTSDPRAFVLAVVGEATR